MIVGLIIFIPIFAADTWFDMNMSMTTIPVEMFEQVQTVSNPALQEVLLREMIE